MSTAAKSLSDIDQDTNILITGKSRRQVMVIKSADEVIIFKRNTSRLTAASYTQLKRKTRM